MTRPSRELLSLVGAIVASVVYPVGVGMVIAAAVTGLTYAALRW